MSDTLRFQRSHLGDSDSPLAGLDRIVAATQPPAATARDHDTPALFTPLGALSLNLRHSRSKEPGAPAYGRLAERDHEVLRLKREVQELADGKRQLEKALAARDAKIAHLEKSGAAAARKSGDLAAQLTAVRAELERTRHRALTDHRQQERRIATLEQTVSRKLGLGRLEACVPQEFFVNPLTGAPARSLGCTPLCATVLKASTSTQQRVEAMVGESLRLEGFCETLERAFGLDADASASAPPDVYARLDTAVHAAAELLEAIVQRFEDGAYEQAADADTDADADADADARHEETGAGAEATALLEFL